MRGVLSITILTADDDNSLKAIEGSFPMELPIDAVVSALQSTLDLIQSKKAERVSPTSIQYPLKLKDILT